MPQSTPSAARGRARAAVEVPESLHPPGLCAPPGARFGTAPLLRAWERGQSPGGSGGDATGCHWGWNWCHHGARAWMCPIWEPLIAAHSFRVPWGREIGLKQPGKGFSLGSSCSGVLPFPFSFPPSPSLSRCSPSSGDPVPEGHWLCKKKGDQWVNELIWHCPRAGLGYVKPSQSSALSGCAGL